MFIKAFKAEKHPNYHHRLFLNTIRHLGIDVKRYCINEINYALTLNNTLRIEIEKEIDNLK